MNIQEARILIGKLTPHVKSKLLEVVQDHPDMDIYEQLRLARVEVIETLNLSTPEVMLVWEAYEKLSSSEDSIKDLIPSGSIVPLR